MWRQDIQVLRAFAVISVLLFHAELPVSGGFLGVDVFFVVSGFVITQLIVREIRSTGRLRLVAFYAARARRLFPALAFMIILTAPLSLVVFPRLSEARPGLITGFLGIFSGANVATALLEFDYFAAPSRENFMTHLWSLSVEEQFYLVFPIALAFLFSLRRSKLAVGVVVSLFTLSLVVAIFGASEGLGLLERGQAFVGFYSPFARAWQFLAGCLVALAPVVSFRAPHRHLLLASGWGALLLSVTFISDIVANLPMLSVIPTAATAVILHAGQADRSNLRWLKWLEAVGDRSYSLYLWHWPFVVFASILLPVSSLAATLGTVVSIPLALLAYKYLENPIRRGWRFPAALFWKAAGGLAVTAMLTIFISAALFQPVERVLGPQASAGDLDETEYYVLAAQISRDCELQVKCFQSKSGSDPEIVIIGNSHGAHLFVGLAESMPSRNVVWVRDSAASYREAPDGVDATEFLLRAKSVEYVVIGDYLSSPRNAFPEKLGGFLDAMAGSGIKVVIPNGSPTLEFPAYKCKFGVIWNPSFKRCEFSATENNQTFQAYSAELKSVTDNYSFVKVVDTYGLFCGQEVCTIGSEEALYFRDLNHFGIEGSRLVGFELAKTMKN